MSYLRVIENDLKDKPSSPQCVKTASVGSFLVEVCKSARSTVKDTLSNTSWKPWVYLSIWNGTFWATALIVSDVKKAFVQENPILKILLFSLLTLNGAAGTFAYICFIKKVFFGSQVAKAVRVLCDPFDINITRQALGGAILFGVWVLAQYKFLSIITDLSSSFWAMQCSFYSGWVSLIGFTVASKLALLIKCEKIGLGPSIIYHRIILIALTLRGMIRDWRA